MPYWWWDPFEEIERMRKRMRRAMQGFLLPVREEFLEGTFPIDVLESKDGSEIIVKADLPGFDKEDVGIRVTENSIEIKARHKEKKIEKTERMYRAERSYGELKRYLTLPVEVKPETAKASMKNGVLEVRIEKAKPKKEVKEVKVE